MKNLLYRIKSLTMRSEIAGDTIEDMLLSTVEELGEVSACISVEKGRKTKELTEDSKQEAIDLLICVLSLYFMKSGDIDEIETIANIKLDKWEENINKRLNNVHS